MTYRSAMMRTFAATVAAGIFAIVAVAQPAPTGRWAWADGRFSGGEA